MGAVERDGRVESDTEGRISVLAPLPSLLPPSPPTAHYCVFSPPQPHSIAPVHSFLVGPYRPLMHEQPVASFLATPSPFSS